MSPSDRQTFLRELDKKLWTAADKLRSKLDPAVACPRGVHPAKRFPARAWGVVQAERVTEGLSEATDKNANFAWIQHMLHHLFNGSTRGGSGDNGKVRVLERSILDANESVSQLILRSA